MMTDLEAILTELRYSPQWLDYGLLTNEFLENQYSQYQISDDKNTEHYRFRDFQTLLINHKVFDDVTVNRYIELAIADTDRSMGDSALALLIRWPGLTDGQLRQLSHNPAYNKPFLQKLHQRITLLRELSSIDLREESFERFLASKDAEVHRVLLSKPDIKSEHLQLLKERGANKAIRNMAEQKLQSTKL